MDPKPVSSNGRSPLPLDRELEREKVRSQARVWLRSEKLRQKLGDYVPGPFRLAVFQALGAKVPGLTLNEVVATFEVNTHRLTLQAVIHLSTPIGSVSLEMARDSEPSSYTTELAVAQASVFVEELFRK